MPPDLTTFVQNLSWTPALVDCCRAWLDACRDLAERQFRAYCERDAQLQWLLTAFLGLPEDLRKQFLLSPWVSNQLLIRDVGHVPPFSALAGDFVRVLARSSDSAAADPDVAEMLVAFGRDNGDLQGIPLDFDSATPFPSRGAGAGELRALSPDRAAETRRRLEEALEALAQGKPIAWECVRLLTRRLAVREEESRADGSASSSFGHLIGLTLLTNPWAERVDAARLLDSLVHESIHAALFLREAVQGPLFLDKNWPDLLHSPWSGNPLNYYQYVQACFVWFGLAHLWKNWPAGAGGVPADRVSHMQRRASQGFLARPVESLLKQAGGRLVPPPVQDALRLMEQGALDADGVAPQG